MHVGDCATPHVKLPARLGMENVRALVLHRAARPKRHVLHINDLTTASANQLSSHASFAVPDGARVGLVGRNGIGKTTLFRDHRGEIALEHGSVSLPRGRAHRRRRPGGAGRPRSR